MAENKLGIGRMMFPSTTDKDLKIALEEFVARVGDNIDYLFKPSIQSVSADHTSTDLDSVVLIDATGGAKTVTLPLAAQNQGKQLKYKKVDASANAVTISRAGSDTIDGATSYSLASQYKYVAIVSDGSNWYVVANN